MDFNIEDWNNLLKPQPKVKRPDFFYVTDQEGNPVAEYSSYADIGVKGPVVIVEVDPLKSAVSRGLVYRVVVGNGFGNPDDEPTKMLYGKNAYGPVIDILRQVTAGLIEQYGDPNDQENAA